MQIFGRNFLPALYGPLSFPLDFPQLCFAEPTFGTGNDYHNDFRGTSFSCVCILRNGVRGYSSAEVFEKKVDHGKLSPLLNYVNSVPGINAAAIFTHANMRRRNDKGSL